MAIIVVGLGPGDAAYLTDQARQLIASSSTVRFRTRRHPAADEFLDVVSYDDWYDRASDFESLYSDIVDDLIRLAQASSEPVVYVVPGSPMVAEHTVELLLERAGSDVRLTPAVSVIDVACAALRIDPMSVGLRIGDVLDSASALAGPGPYLMLQAYSPEVLAMFADRVPADTAVTILHHLGLPDERLVSMSARELPTFREADHLTSVYIPQLRGAAVAVNELIELMIRLRRDCAWDQEQTHESLARHLIEEAYETIDALNNYSAALESGEGLESAAYDAEEELGDLLFQIVFHAHLGTEEDAFSLETIADHVHNKLVARHPHVFGDVEVANATDAESRWENLKKAEKSRESVTDGIAWDLPGFVLHAKLQRKAHSVGAGDGDRDEAVASLRTALGELTHNVESSDAWEQVVRGLSVLARHVGVDIENVARREALALRDEIRRIEGLS